MLEESVLQCFVARVAAGSFEQQLVLLRTKPHRYNSTITSSKRFTQTVTDTWANKTNHLNWCFWTYGIEISDGLDLLIVIRPGQLSKPFWVKLAAVWEELGAVLLGQLCAERVDGDDEGSPVGLELQQHTAWISVSMYALLCSYTHFRRSPACSVCLFTTHLQNRTHGVGRGSSEVGAELVKSLQVSLRGRNSKCTSGNQQTNKYMNKIITVIILIQML